jgi:hypothetical protein
MSVLYLHTVSLATVSNCSTHGLGSFEILGDLSYVVRDKDKEYGEYKSAIFPPSRDTTPRTLTYINRSFRKSSWWQLMTSFSFSLVYSLSRSSQNGVPLRTTLAVKMRAISTAEGQSRTFSTDHSHRHRHGCASNRIYVLCQWTGELAAGGAASSLKGAKGNWGFCWHYGAWCHIAICLATRVEQTKIYPIHTKQHCQSTYYWNITHTAGGTRLIPLPPNVIYTYMSYSTANLQMLHFKYLFNKCPYRIF